MADRAPAVATIGGRIAVAAAGGYAATYAVTAALASVGALTPLGRNDAASFAALIGICLYPVLIVWTFAAATVRRAVAGVGGLLAASLLVVWLVRALSP